MLHVKRNYTISIKIVVLGKIVAAETVIVVAVAVEIAVLETVVERIVVVQIHSDCI